MANAPPAGSTETIQAHDIEFGPVYANSPEQKAHAIARIKKFFREQNSSWRRVFRSATARPTGFHKSTDTNPHMTIDFWSEDGQRDTRHVYDHD
ncbi:hypothetical protein EIP91_005329 [Steccherinum ochraceum]|uniref:Uncharacterized protein n=1 Tax=Steccherinum ochraceum TaxID=92696 RepID=A0A4R0RIC6_9APHY|nr:hypothetical protein EIP91_005329 [Steccherinum ochraceum]